MHVQKLPIVTNDAHKKILGNLQEIISMIKHGIIPYAETRDPTDTGCCVTVVVPQENPRFDWQPTLQFFVGAAPKENWQLYSFYALEKAFRLSKHPEHISAFESNNTEPPNTNPHLAWDLKRYPGAVRLENDGPIISVSGLHWKYDERVCFEIGLRFGLMSEEYCKRLCNISGNDIAF